MSRLLASAAIAVVVAGCGSSESSLEQHFRRGIENVRTTHDKKKLHARLERTLANLRRDRAENATARKAKRFASAGFRSTLAGLESQIAFVDNDRGNPPIAARDAARGYHLRLVGARLLRRAGSLLGVSVGSLDGY